MESPTKISEAVASPSAEPKESDKKGGRKKKIRVFLTVLLIAVVYAWAIQGVVRLWRAYSLLVAGDAEAEAKIAVLQENLDVPLDLTDESDVETDEEFETPPDDWR